MQLYKRLHKVVAHQFLYLEVPQNL